MGEREAARETEHHISGMLSQHVNATCVDGVGCSEGTLQMKEWDF